MFEKESEEYQIRKHHQRLYGHKPVVMKELNTTYKDGFKDGYNKANEWNKVRDKLPPMGEIVYLWHENERFPVCAYRHIPYGKTEKDWVWECYWGSGYTVTQSVAKDYWWKEIALPKKGE